MYLDSIKLRNKCSIVIDRINNIEDDVPFQLKQTYNWKTGDIIAYKQDFDNNLIFCQPEFFNVLQEYNIDLSDKILITHHSDVNILEWDGNKAKFSLGPHIKFEKEKLNPKRWFGRNTCCDSVEAIPCGLYPERYGKMEMIQELYKKDIDKEYLLYLNFNPNSNIDRVECLKYTKLSNHYITNGGNDSEYKFLLDVKKSYFILSPNGFGIDCHRHWEAIQLGAIPIVTKSKLVEQLSKYYPFYIIDSWKQFNKNIFTEELYYNIWSKFDTRYLDLDFLLNKMINNE